MKNETATRTWGRCDCVGAALCMPEAERTGLFLRIVDVSAIAPAPRRRRTCIFADSGRNCSVLGECLGPQNHAMPSRQCPFLTFSRWARLSVDGRGPEAASPVTSPAPCVRWRMSTMPRLILKQPTGLPPTGTGGGERRSRPATGIAHPAASWLHGRSARAESEFPPPAALGSELGGGAGSSPGEWALITSGRWKCKRTGHCRVTVPKSQKMPTSQPWCWSAASIWFALPPGTQ